MSRYLLHVATYIISLANYNEPHMKYHLAQVNIASIIAPMDSPVMADFVASLDSINALAESSEGFIWRLKGEGNDATSLRIYDNDFLIVNMSVWKDTESLFRFVYQTNHVDIFRRRKEWFTRMPDMHMALWYVPEGHTPGVKEAEERLNHIRLHGPTAHAFTFKKRFLADGTPVTEIDSTR